MSKIARFNIQHVSNIKNIFMFLQCSGQLPQPYEISDDIVSTRKTRSTFNDLNLQEGNRFVQDPTLECDYIVDQTVHIDYQTDLEPDFGRINSDVWKPIFSLKFLDAKRSPRLFRAFYVPFLSENKCIFNNYTLFKNIRQKI